MHPSNPATITVRELSQALAAWAPTSLQETYDNAGLLAGEPESTVRGVLVSLDCTEAVVNEAIARGCNVVVSHHPLIFGGLKSLTGANWVERTLIKALRAGVALYAIHTNLDNVAHGVNAELARRIGLQGTQILSPKTALLRKLVTFVPAAQASQVREALWAAGAGTIGNYDRASFTSEGIGTFRPLEGAQPNIGDLGQTEAVNEVRVEVILENHREKAVLRALFAAHPYEEVAYDLFSLQNASNQIGSGAIGNLSGAVEFDAFLQRVKNTFGGGLRYTTSARAKVQKIAVCGGSGSFLLEKAVAAGADVLLTADFKYHQFLEADNRIAIVDIGHFESEQFTIPLIADYLREKFTNFATLTSETKTNPVNYL